MKENARPKPNTAVPRNTGPALGETTNEDTSNVGKRSRKPSEKVAIQAVQEKTEKARRQEAALRKAVRAQRNAPDTEEEGDNESPMPSDEDPGDEESEEGEEEEPHSFSSRIVDTRVSRKTNYQAIQKPTLIRSNGRVPISQAAVAEEDDDEHMASDRGERSLDRDELKRQRSESVDSLRDAKVAKHTSGNRPKASDFQDLTKECLALAISVYRCLISTTNPFPDHTAETQLAGEAWAIACEDLETNDPLTPKISKLITNRGSHLRGELKTKARPIVETYYDFESGIHQKIIARNRDVAEELKDGYGYTYKQNHRTHSERRGLYKNPLIQKIVNVMWFRNRQDEGIKFNKYFHPIKPEMVALVLTVIDCCIDEWMTGIRADCAFTTAAYRDTYLEHLQCIEEFKSHDERHGNNKIFDNISLKLYNRGRFHGGAQPISLAKMRVISSSAFEAAIKEYKEDEVTESDGETGIMSA